MCVKQAWDSAEATRAPQLALNPLPFYPELGRPLVDSVPFLDVLCSLHCGLLSWACLKHKQLAGALWGEVSALPLHQETQTDPREPMELDLPAPEACLGWTHTGLMTEVCSAGRFQNVVLFHGLRHLLLLNP